MGNFFTRVRNAVETSASKKPKNTHEKTRCVVNLEVSYTVCRHLKCKLMLAHGLPGENMWATYKQVW